MANSEDSRQQQQPATMADFSYRRHVEYFLDVLLEQLPSPYQESDPNRVTIAYFAISALDLLNALDQASDRLLKKGHESVISSTSMICSGFHVVTFYLNCEDRPGH